MRRDSWFSFGSVRAMALGMVVLCAGSLLAQSPARPAEKTSAPAASSTPMSNEQITDTRDELFKLLSLSSRLAGAVAHDPSLLADQEYVGRNNPELAKFLQNHPEVVRNPEFYLFANIEVPGRPSQRLSINGQRVFFESRDPGFEHTKDFMAAFLIFLAFGCILAALLWVLRVLLENRRWSRLFRTQSEIYNKLLDKFGSSEEFLAYVRGDAGKAFLESFSVPPMAASPGSALGRILWPLQAGVVLMLGGIGLIWVRGSVPEIASPLLVFGTLALTLGIGFAISAGISLLLARHLGLTPRRESGQVHGAALPRSNDSF